MILSALDLCISSTYMNFKNFADTARHLYRIVSLMYKNLLKFTAGRD
jgi:hypothetical protein